MDRDRLVGYIFLYNSRVIKLQSDISPWCAGSSLRGPRVRCLRWWCCDAVDCGGMSWQSVWRLLYIFISVQARKHQRPRDA